MRTLLKGAPRTNWDLAVSICSLCPLPLAVCSTLRIASGAGAILHRKALRRTIRQQPGRPVNAFLPRAAARAPAPFCPRWPRRLQPVRSPTSSSRLPVPGQLPSFPPQSGGMSFSSSVATASALPILSPAAASTGSLLVTATYVGSLYLAKSARIPHAAGSSSEAASAAEQERLSLGRDHPDVIRARLKAVGGATVACCVGIWAVVQLGMGESTVGLGAVRTIACRCPSIALADRCPIAPVFLARVAIAGGSQDNVDAAWLPALVERLR
jgi:hypothetical protein